MSQSAEKIVKDILLQADISVGGNRPQDIHIHDDRFYKRILSGGSLALGESYMDGWWDANDLATLIAQTIQVDLRSQIHKNWRVLAKIVPQLLPAYLGHYGTKTRSKNIADAHYDAGNDLYEKMLGETMAYTCGYWRDATTLDDAQNAKFDLICRKLNLKKGMRVLDIGCGWGSFMRYAAKHYGVKCVGATVSKEQTEFGVQFTKGLPVEFRLSDYRDLDEKFDAIVSIGMFEHVGPRYYKEFFAKSRVLLKDDGLMLLHTIGSHRNRRVTDAWLDRYIFPGGVIPSLQYTAAALQPYFVMEDWHNFGVDYDRTLMAWHKNFSTTYPLLHEGNKKYDERFRRMWEYYLLSCAGAFRARHIQLWQIVLSPKGSENGYRRVS